MLADMSTLQIVNALLVFLCDYRSLDFGEHECAVCEALKC
jgi:hypothetical protein